MPVPCRIRPHMRWALVVAICALLTACGSTAPKGGQSSQSSRMVLINARLPGPDAPTTITVDGASFLPSGSGALVVALCRAQGCTGMVWLLAENQGASWTSMTTGLPPFVGIQVLPGGDLIGWTANQVYRSAQGANNWQRIFSSNAGLSLQVVFASPAVGYVGEVGSPATESWPYALFRTSDGGRTWTEVAQNALGTFLLPPESGTGDIPLPEPALLAAVGEDQVALYSSTPEGTVAVSANGGRRWETTLSLSGGAPEVVIAPSGVGWASESNQTGTGMQFFQTTDGGAAWSRLGIGPADSFFQLALAPDGSPWALAPVAPTAGCSGCEIGAGAVTVLDGKVQVQAHALPGGVTPTGLVPISAQAALVMANGPTGGDVFLTVNGGASWKTVSATASWLFPEDAVGFWNTTQGWGVGSGLGGPEFMISSDGGKSWQALTPFPKGLMVNLNWSGFSSRADGWVLGDGRVYLTTDGGRSWSVHTLPGGFIVTLAFPSATHASLIVDQSKGGPGVLDVTTDGAKTWRTVLSGVRAAAWTPGGALLAARASGSTTALLRSTNGGRTWQVVRSLPASADVEAIGEAADGTLWAEGLSQIWLWPKHSAPVEIRLPANTYLQSPPSVISAQLIDLFTGQAIYRTANGGQSWSLVASGPAQNP